jgi:hypothetical protein
LLVEESEFFVVSTGTPSKSFLSSYFLVNTADRVIRVYDSKEVMTCGDDGEPEPIQKLQDLVNK